LQNQDHHNWFSLPIEVTNISNSCEFVPISLQVDLTKSLESMGQYGVVDERSLRLYRIDPDGNEYEEPYQFSSDVEPRYPQRHLLTSKENVSWGSEWQSDQKLTSPKVKGVFTWIAKGDSKGCCRYKLLFGIPSDKIAVQVPFLPNNLRHFDAHGKPTPLRWFPVMQIRPQWTLDGVVHIFNGGSLITAYHTGPLLNEPINFARIPRRPYFYPVNGPDGVSLTELGKPHDPTGSHAHHYSLWIAHNDVGGNDFWSERGGLICHEQFELMEDGALFARLVQKTRWLKDGNGYLDERRQITVYATPEDFRLIDMDLELSASSSKPVELGKTPFGFLAARVAQSMTVFDGSGEIINSEGQRNEQYAFWQRARWIDQSGAIAPDKWGGIAIFDHPDNPNYPTAWHCRNDGWAGTSFNLDSAWKIEAGNPLRLKYRIHLHRHDANTGGVPTRYSEYICNPRIDVGVCRPA
jgi:hypothetical protein